jgi:hypothetical protein
MIRINGGGQTVQFAWSDHCNRGGQTREIGVVRSGEIRHGRIYFYIYPEHSLLAIVSAEISFHKSDNPFVLLFREGD